MISYKSLNSNALSDLQFQKTANVMMLAGKPIRGGHYGTPVELSALGSEDNPRHSVDFRRVYASLIDSWLGSSSQVVLGEAFSGFDFFRV